MADRAVFWRTWWDFGFFVEDASFCDEVVTFMVDLRNALIPVRPEDEAKIKTARPW
jgi:hypothetical protein